MLRPYVTSPNELAGVPGDAGVGRGAAICPGFLD